MATANLNDMATLATDPVFGNRVMVAVVNFCTNVVPGEAVPSIAMACQLHISRKNLAAAIVNNPSSFKSQFVGMVAGNQIVANEATAGGTIVGDTGATLATAALLCLDADINNAVAAGFNAFIPNI